MLSILLCLLAPLAAAQDRSFDSAGVRIRDVDYGSAVKPWMRSTAAPLLDHLAIDKAHVVGYSLGGIIAAKLLTTHPQRFASALLGGAAYRRSRSERSDREADAAAREIEAGVYRALLVSTAPTDEPSLKEEDIRARSAQIAERNDQRALAALMRARRALVVSDAEIATVRVPSLAVVGAADPALPRVKAMQGVWAGLEVVVLPGATHPTVHPRSLPRHAAFREAIRGHIARAKHRPHI